MSEQPYIPQYAFQKATPCLAKTRRGTLCKAPAANGKGRCRLHGGAKGSGAPKGNRNAYKHGKYTKKALELNASIRLLSKHIDKVRFTNPDTIGKESLNEMIDDHLDFSARLDDLIHYLDH